MRDIRKIFDMEYIVPCQKYVFPIPAGSGYIPRCRKVAFPYAKTYNTVGLQYCDTFLWTVLYLSVFMQTYEYYSLNKSYQEVFFFIQEKEYSPQSQNIFCGFRLISELIVINPLQFGHSKISQ